MSVEEDNAVISVNNNMDENENVAENSDIKDIISYLREFPDAADSSANAEDPDCNKERKVNIVIDDPGNDLNENEDMADDNDDTKYDISYLPEDPDNDLNENEDVADDNDTKYDISYLPEDPDTAEIFAEDPDSPEIFAEDLDYNEEPQATEDSDSDYLEETTKKRKRKFRKKPDKLLKCKYEGCYFTSVYRSSLREHTWKHTGEKLVCPICNSKYSHYSQYHKHLKKHSTIKNYAPKTNRKPRPNLIIKRKKCQYCDFICIWNDTMVNHERMHTHKYPFICIWCDAVFQYKPELFHHYNRHAGQSMMCPTCDFVTSERRKMIIHQRRHSDERPFQCSYGCNYTGKSKARIILHESLHKRPLLSCSFCPFQCIDRYELARHQRTHKATLKYKCSECNHAFNIKAKRDRHMATHLVEQPLKCDQCKFGCKFPGVLTAHRVKFHNADGNDFTFDETTKLFRCGLCPETYKSRRTLRYHQETHKVDHPVKCDKCSFGCRRKEELSKHCIRFHDQPGSDVSLLQCSLCVETFRRRDLLKRHEGGHKINYPIGCKFCAYRGISVAKLTKHVSTYHKDQSILKPEEYTVSRREGEKKLVQLKDGHVFKCPDCDTVFKHKENYHNHKKRHLTPQPYNCEICSFPCQQKGALKKHKEVYHNATGVSSQMRTKRVKGAAQKRKEVHRKPTGDSSQMKTKRVKGAVQKRKKVHRKATANSSRRTRSENKGKGTKPIKRHPVRLKHALEAAKKTRTRSSGSRQEASPRNTASTGRNSHISCHDYCVNIPLVVVKEEPVSNFSNYEDNGSVYCEGPNVRVKSEPNINEIHVSLVKPCYVRLCRLAT